MTYRRTCIGGAVVCDILSVMNVGIALMPHRVFPWLVLLNYAAAAYSGYVAQKLWRKRNHFLLTFGKDL